MDFRQITSLSTTDQLSDVSSIKHNLDGPAHLFHLLTVSFLLLVHSSHRLSDVFIVHADRRVPSVISSRLCWGAVLNLSRSLARTSARSCLGVVFLGTPVRRSLCSFMLPRSLYFSQRFVTVEGL